MLKFVNQASSTAVSTPEESLANQPSKGENAQMDKTAEKINKKHRPLISALYYVRNNIQWNSWEKKIGRKLQERQEEARP